jgi:hypothetical protein
VAVKEQGTRPRWPSETIDSGLAWVDYDIVADEFLVYFGGQPVPAITYPFEAPGFEATAVMIGLDPDHKETGEIVGIHVIPMMLEAVPAHPEWSVLTWAVLAGEYGTELVRERLPIFIDEVAEAFEKYWQPAPPIEEQLAAMRRASRERKSA